MVPIGVVIGALRMEPVLDAEEAIDSVARIQVGIGAGDKTFQQRQIAAWERAAGVQRRLPVRARKLNPEHLQRLSKTGMAIVKVPSRG